MFNYKPNHQTFRFDVDTKVELGDRRFVIKRLPLAALHARIPMGAGEPAIVPLAATPHFALLAGNPAAYVSHMNGAGKEGVRHSMAAFDACLQSKDGYLSPGHASSYIVCEIVDDRCVILDGLHRAAVLMQQKIESIPVAIRLEKSYPATQIEEYLVDYKNDFLEWYTPVQIGALTIHERTYPNFKERPEFLQNRERGQAKFDYIIRKNLPKLEGKTVCDVGCSVGLLSYNLLKMGAKSVDGFDRSETTVQPTNTQLPRQSVVQQASFVKNLLQLHDNRAYDQLNFYERDIATLDFKTFNYDLFFSCCVLYHFGERFETIIRDISGSAKEVFLQANLGHSGELARYASVPYHRELLEKYGYRVRIDAPDGYQYPVIVGTK